MRRLTPRPLAAAAVLLGALLTTCSDDAGSSAGEADTAADGSVDSVPDGDSGDGPGDLPVDSAPDVEILDGEALVTWTAPTTRSDGSSLAEDAIGGYRVHYGTAPRQYDHAVDVGPAGSARIGGLAPGTRYYFAVTAYDAADRESDFSAEVFKDL